jgi:sec-independent protein translocase protein TatB
LPDGELTVFDLSFEKLFVLAVIALIVFGPNELPKMFSQAGRTLRDLRRIAEGAKNDLREGLGPEFADFEIEDLNPKRFVAKHLFEEPNGNAGTGAPASAQEVHPARQAGGSGSGSASATLLPPGERAPYDPDAT